MGGKIYSEIEMKEAEPNEQLGTSTLGFVFAHVTHLRRFMHPETKHQVLFSHFFGGVSRPVLWGGYLGISLGQRSTSSRPHGDLSHWQKVCEI